MKFLEIIFILLPFLVASSCQTINLRNPASRNISARNSLSCSSFFDFESASQKIVELTNEYRVQNGRKPLENKIDLEEFAASWSEQMARTNNFNHRSEILLPGYRSAAENIAYFSFIQNQSAFGVAQQLVDQWINSPGHRQNMLDNSSKYIGAGVFCVGNGVYGTQNFGS